MSDHLDRCSACRNWAGTVHFIPVIGLVCTPCFEILEQPTLLEGAVTGESLRSIAIATQLEFAGRTESLKKKAMAVVLQQRQPQGSAQ